MPNSDKLVTLADLKEAYDDVNSRAGVTGVKGNAESDYRRDNVNLTPENIGAVSKSGDTMTGNLTVSRAGNSGFYANNTNNSNQIGLINGSSGKSGVYSSQISDFLIYIDGNGAVCSNFFASSVYLTSAMNTQALIYAELSKLVAGHVSTVIVAGGALKLLTGKELNFDAQGTVYRSSNNYYFDLTRLSGSTRWGFKATVTASAITPDTVYQYTGTALS